MLMLCSYSHAIPFEVTLCNVDFKDDSNVSFVKQYYLQSGNTDRLPGYCNTLLQGLQKEIAGSSEAKISTIFSALFTALSVLKSSDNFAAYETAKSRVFGAKSVMDIMVAQSADLTIESSA
jgi:hypothetical protein